MNKKQGFMKGNIVTYNVLSVGLASGICLAIGIFIGLEIDTRYNSAPTGILGGIIFGIISAVTYMIRQIRLNMKRFENERNSFKGKAKKQ